MATFRLDDYIAESKVDPFELDCGDQGRFVLNYPDGDTLTQLTECPLNQTRRIFQLLTGDLFDQIWPIVAPLPGKVLSGVINDVISHFNLGQVQQLPGGSRASRR